MQSHLPPGDPLPPRTPPETLARPVALISPARSFGILGAVGWLVLFMVLDATFGAVASVVTDGSDAGYLIGVNLGMLLAALVIVHLCYFRRERQYLALREVFFPQIVCILMLLLPMEVFFSYLRHPLEWLYHGAGIDEELFRAHNSYGYLWETTNRLGLFASAVFAIFLYGVFPAVTEELFFRGFLGRGLLARLRPSLAVVVASLLFGLAHRNLVHSIVTTFVGILLHLLYLWCRSLFAPVVCHALFNVQGVFLAWMEPNRLPAALTGAEVAPWPLLLAAGLSLTATLWLLSRMATRWVLPDGSTWTPGYVSAEMPPPMLQATARRGRPPWAAVGLAVFAFIAFLVALAVPTVSGPLPGESEARCDHAPPL